MKVIERVCAMLKDGEPVVLAVILSQSGSTPRSAGAMMAVRQDGRIEGTVGGGVVEAAVIREAQALFDSEAAGRVLAYDLSNDDTASAGMVCGGKVSICVRRLEPQNGPQLTGVQELLKRGKRCVLLFPMERIDLPAGCVVPEEAAGSVFPGVAAGAVRQVLRLGFPDRIGTPDGPLLAVPFADPGTVVITGAGHVAQQTARLTVMAGFRTVVQDDREAFANRERFPEADEVQVLPSFDDCFGELDPGPETYFIVITRGHLHDKRVLHQALQRPAAYVGMIGSTRKRDACYAALLKEEGVTRVELDRVHCPIGLSIGAETPEEIAVSIVAELIQVRADRRNS